jgi:hypothetical protein
MRVIATDGGVRIYASPDASWPEMEFMPLFMPIAVFLKKSPEWTPDWTAFIITLFDRYCLVTGISACW